jgi:ParB family chromosome partitioning protein
VTPLSGPWVERLEAIAVGREVVAVAGRRDAAGPARVHVVPTSLLDGKGAAWSLPAGACTALAFAGDDLLITGGDDGRLIAWDVTGQKAAGELALGAAVRALAVDAGVARGDAGTIAVATADGALHLVAFAVKQARPALGPVERRALSDGAIAAVAWDPAGLWLAGGADGQLWIVDRGQRAVLPGGDGGIRAIVSLGDGRAAIGCGDGSLRICFVVGAVEPVDRSGDHGHQLALRALALGPQVTDDAGRELPRRLFSAGDDGALKIWFVDGNRRPRALELGLGPVTALAFAPGPIARPVAVERAAGRLWLAGAHRKVAALALGPEIEPAGEPIAIGSELDRLEAQLASGVAVKVQLAAIDAIAELAEDEARVLLDGALAGGPPEVKLAVTRAMVRSARRASRPALRAALAAQPVELRAAAFHALLELEADQPLAAIRAGLGAAAEDVRTLAVAALVPLGKTSVIAAGLVADALRDAHPTVRRRAYAALRELARDPAEAIRTALARGTPDVRAEALLDLGFAVRDGSPAARALTAGAFDDADPGVRVAAFLAALVQRPALAARLTAPIAAGAAGSTGALTTSASATAAGATPASTTAAGTTAAGATAAGATAAGATAASATAAGATPAASATASTSRLAQVNAALAERFAQIAQAAKLTLPADTGAPLDDDELEPLFAQLACRSADAAVRGAGGLLVLGDRRAAGAILQLTREADPVQRRAATAQLVRALATWPDDDRLAPRLSWLLDDGDPEVRGFAFDALARDAAAAGAAAELELAETALRTSQDDIRVRALQILVRVGAPGSPVAAHGDALLGDALDDEAASVRHEAFRTLQTWHASAPMVSLARGARSRHGDLRTLVVQELDRRRAAKPGSLARELDALLRQLVGDPVAAVGLAAYAALTRQPADGPEVAIPDDVHLAAMASPAAAVRAAGAKGAGTEREARPAAALRARLIELVKDDHPPVHLAAIEALDALVPGDAEGLALAFASIFYELQVRAGELAGRRRDARAVAPMQRLLAIAKTDVNRPAPVLRQRAAHALADAGEPSSIAFQLALIEDDDPIVREMAARGIATAARPDSDAARAALVALLGHADLAVRSWGGEGLAKLGDLRALPVLAGTQRHDHRPLRIGAIVGFVALGADGVRGLRQGLEDADREIADLAFAVIVARDAALAAAGIAPDLLVDALASPSPELRFAAARLYERRQAGDALDADAIGELIGPRKPDKAAELKGWPTPARRAALLQVVADAIASDDPGRRYAATQVLATRPQPLTFWREAARLAGPAASAPAPYTSSSSETRTARRAGWVRRLVGERRDPEAGELEAVARLFLRAGRASAGELAAAQRLVFGVYAGLVRQAPARGAADETHRVRRDAIARLVELAREDAVGAEAVLPVLGHAVGDPHHLVRQAAMAALRSLYPVGALAPLQLAIAGAADLGKAAIDELVGLAAAGDDRARALLRAALDADDADVRAHAARRLARLYPAGSAEPQLLAAGSRHADVRLAAITELAAALEDGRGDAAAITDALVAALASEHADLRLRAATALARRGNPLGVEVLGGFLRDEQHLSDALEALQDLASGKTAGDGVAAAAEAIASRLDEVDRGQRGSLDEYDESRLVEVLGEIGHPIGAPVLVRRLIAPRVRAEDEGELDVDATFAAILDILRDRGQKPRELPDGRVRRRLRDDLALTHLGDLARSVLPAVRVKASNALGEVDARGAEDVLARLLGDRAPEVRVAAAEALALRAEHVPDATLSALEAALRGGRRELVLPAAFGLAMRGRPEAFQPLLLVMKAGEPAEQERAVLALGALGDKRALAQLRPLLDPAPDDEVARALTPAVAEALGRLIPVVGGDDAAELRARLERLALAGSVALRQRALTGLRHAGELGLVEAVAADREAMTTLREHAVEQLGLAAAPASEPVLVELLSDDNHAVREAALAALAKVLGGDRTRVSVHALGSPHEHISGPAARYLATAGDPATLVARLGSVRSAKVREMLREGLIRRGALPADALAAALRGGDAIARGEAAWIAGYAGPAAHALRAAVEAAAGQGAPIARAGRSLGPAQLAEIDAAWASLWAARRLGGAAATEPIAQVVLAEDRAPAGLRREAAAGLALAGSPAARATLAKAIDDGDREVRAIAANALAAVEPRAAAPAVRAVGSRADATTIAPLALAAWPELAAELVADEATRSWALAVSLIGRRVDELVAIAAGRGATSARIAAIGALGRLGGDAAKQALEAIHDSAKEDDAIKLAAWKALKRIARKPGKTYAEGQDKGPGAAAGASSDDDADDDADADDDEVAGDDADADADAGDGDDDDADSDDGGDDDDDDDGDDDDDDGDDDDDDEDDDD